MMFLAPLMGCGGAGSSAPSAEVAVVAAPAVSVVTPTTSPTPTPAPAAQQSAGSATPVSYAADTASCLFLNGIVYTLSSIDAPPYACSTEEGGAVQRFEVRPGDRGWSGDFNHGTERVELVTEHGQVAHHKYIYKSGTDVWISYSFKVDAGAPVTSRRTIVGQMHPIKDDADMSLAPDIYFELGQGSGTSLPFTLYTNADARATTLVQPPATTQWSGSIKRGEWVDLVLRVRFDPFGEGQVQLWVNGTQQLNRAHVAIGYNNRADQAYWQYGIYRLAEPNPLVVRYANMEQGTASLQARIASPLAR